MVCKDMEEKIICKDCGNPLDEPCEKTLGDNLIKGMEEAIDYMKDNTYEQSKSTGQVIETDGEVIYDPWRNQLEYDECKRNFEETPSGALKDTAGKPDVSLVPLDILECIAEPLTYGQLKGYPRNNWLQGVPFTKSLAAALRHLALWQQGIDWDAEAHDKHDFLMCHINAALFHISSIALMTKRNRGDLDDR